MEVALVTDAFKSMPIALAADEQFGLTPTYCAHLPSLADQFGLVCREWHPGACLSRAVSVVNADVH